MNAFEKEYYESPGFWDNGMVLDQANIDRIKKTVSIIPNDVHSLADIGCGNGVFLNHLIDQNSPLMLLGVDRSVEALKHVKAKKTEGDITNLAFPDKSFDCISCLEVIEHLPVPVYRQSLSELARLAKKYIIISVPYNEILEDAQTQCPSCKSIFNSDLHLRSFKKDDMLGLFDEFGFKNIGIEKLGEIVTYKGHQQYRKLFYPDQLLKWKSPICPICGFKEKNELSTNVSLHGNPAKKRFLSYFTGLPKLVWPKSKRHYWILGIYQRISDTLL